MTKILIVDDEKPIQSFLKRLLALHGYAADAVGDGAEAIDQLQRKHYDLMLIDHYMPNITGPEAIAVVRSSPKFRTLKIVMLTGASLTREIDDVYRLGINGYLLKPIHVAKLLETVAKALLPDAMDSRASALWGGIPRSAASRGVDAL